jgi:hypothetical protein
MVPMEPRDSGRSMPRNRIEVQSAELVSDFVVPYRLIRSFATVLHPVYEFYANR